MISLVSFGLVLILVYRNGMSSAGSNGRFKWSADCKRGRRKGATSKIVKKCQKVFRHFSTIFVQGKKRQKSSKSFSTLFDNFRAALFSGPFCNPLKWEASRFGLALSNLSFVFGVFSRFSRDFAGFVWGFSQSVLFPLSWPRLFRRSNKDSPKCLGHNQDLPQKQKPLVLGNHQYTWQRGVQICLGLEFADSNMPVFFFTI